MTIFASRQLNNDPAPYLWPEHLRTLRLSDGPLRSMFSHGNDKPLIFDPRPEFNLPMTVGVNPILSELRLAVRNWGDESEDGNGPFAERYHRWLEYAEKELLGFDYTVEHLEHARRMLTRLVGLAGEPAPR